MQLILFSGKQGSGKDTIANEVKRNLEMERFGNKKVAIIKFASVIYEAHDAVLDVLRKYKIEVPQKDGSLLQDLGTKHGRLKYGEDIWVKCFQEKLKQLNVDYAIATDCRFQNEHYAFPEALRVRLSCPEDVRRSRALGWREDTNHVSETDLDPIANNPKGFDLTLQTHITSINGCADLVLAQIRKNNWLEKR